MAGFEYCVCCQRNHNDGARHRFARGHQKSLRHFLDREREKVAAVKDLMGRQKMTTRCASEVKYWCRFCGEEVANRAEKPLKQTVKHLSSDAHRESVKRFAGENGTVEGLCDYNLYTVDPAKATKYLRTFYFQAIRSAEEATRQAAWQSEVEADPSGQAYLRALQSPEAFQAFLAAEDARKQREAEAAHRRQPPAAPRPPGASPVAAPAAAEGLSLGFVSLRPSFSSTTAKTMRERGVEQNATGRNAKGERVWGGGIRWVPSAQWLAWPIDEILLSFFSKERSQLETAPSATPVPSFTHSDSDDATDLDKDRSLPIGLDGSVVDDGGADNSFIYTSEITLPAFEPSHGNVHSNALPPWLTLPADTASTVSAFSSWEAIRKEIRHRKKAAKESRYLKKHRVEDLRIARGEEAGKSWLPNFGSVWQGGARSETRQAFLERFNSFAPYEGPKEAYSTEERNTDFGERLRLGAATMSSAADAETLRRHKEMLRDKLRSRSDRR